MEKKISGEDLKAILEFKMNASMRSVQVEKAVLESEKADLQYQNTMLRLYVKYGLSSENIIDEVTGEITVKKHEAEPEESCEQEYGNT
jgi:hypothetical protein